MSNLPTKPEDKGLVEPATDISERDLPKIQKFIDDGLPGLAAVDDAKLYRMMDLYLSGGTYESIASALEIKKVIVLYLSQKFDWYGTKREYLVRLDEQIRSRVVEVKLTSQDFLLQLIQMWQKKIGNSVQRYLATGDAQHANAINLKEVTQMLKAIEMLSDLGTDGKDSKGKSPLVGLNPGQGVVIEKTGENKLTITPKEQSIGDMLKVWADQRREAEAAARPESKRDKEESNTNNGEKDET